MRHHHCIGPAYEPLAAIDIARGGLFRSNANAASSFSLAALCALDAVTQIASRRIGVKFADVTRSLLPVSPFHF